MKKLFIFQFLFLSFITNVNAQETIAINNGDCRCVKCGLNFNCNDASDDCIIWVSDFARKKKRIKGTHMSSNGTIINMVPNPTDGYSVITINEDFAQQMIGLTVYDLNGNIMQVATFAPTQSYTADFSSLPANTYVLSIEIDGIINGSNIISEQFVKQ